MGLPLVPTRNSGGLQSQDQTFLSVTGRGDLAASGAAGSKA